MCIVSHLIFMTTWVHFFVNGVKNNRNKNKLHSVIDHHNQKMAIRMKHRKVWLSLASYKI